MLWVHSPEVGCWRIRRFLWAGSVAFAFALSASALADLSVSAKLEPAHIVLGQSAQLRVVVSGARIQNLDLPTVAGMDLARVGSSTQMQFVNGIVTASVTYLYQVTPHQEGTITIPPISASAGAEKAQSAPLTLVVSKAPPGATAPQGGTSPAASSSPPPSPADIGTVTLTAPERKFFVGELVPIEIKAVFPLALQFSLNAPPLLKGEAFTLNKFSDQPAQSQEVIAGRPYRVLTWNAAVAAVKGGDFSLSIELPVTALLEQKMPRTRANDPFFDNSIFDDAFFDSFFARRVPRQFVLTTAPRPVSVQPLPDEERPANFNGAVGQFRIRAEASPRALKVGDPVTLRLMVEGRGNFDRVISSGLTGDDTWQTYVPTAEFQSRDGIGYEGTKTFEQAAIPKEAGKVVIPGIELAYFDPVTAKYQVSRSAPIEIEVSASPAGASTLASAAVEKATQPEATAEAKQPEPLLVPNKIDLGGFVATLEPVMLRPVYWCANALPAVALMLGLWWRRRVSDRARDPRYHRARRVDATVREQLQLLRQAAADGQAMPFFVAARRIFQERFGQRWEIPAEAITLAELDNRGHGVNGELRAIFQKADEVIYSGRAMNATELAPWREQVERELKRLEAA